MSSTAWQLIVALLVVAAAVAVLARRIYRLVRSSGSHGCGTGGCGTCATNVPQAGAQLRPLVGLDLLKPSNDVSATAPKSDAKKPIDQPAG